MTLDKFNEGLSDADKVKFNELILNDTKDYVNSVWFISEKLDLSLYDAYKFIKSYTKGRFNEDEGLISVAN